MAGVIRDRWQSLRTLAALWLVAVVLSSNAAAQSSDVQLIEGLRSRRLFDLAAQHCRDVLAKSDLDPEEQAEITGQLIRVFGEQAMHASSDQRAGWWKQSHETAAEFAAKYKDHPRLLVVRVQDALVLCAEGEMLRQEAEAARGDAASQFAVALEVLRTAARALEQLDKDIGQVMPSAPRVAEGAVLSADELFALRNHVRLELARVYRNRGLCYPDGDDRIAAITQALEPLTAALSQLPADDPLAWRARIEQAICYRMLGNAPDAGRLLESLTSADVPAEFAPAIRAEEIRAALAARQLDEALSKATQQLPVDAQSHPEFVLARLEAVIAQWQLASSGEQQKAAEWRAQAVALTKFMEQSHGGYWGRRAESLLLRSAAGGSGAGDVEILRRRADDFWHQGHLAESIAAYDEAAEAASSAGLTDEEFLCRFRAALVVQKTEDARGALDRFRELAVKLSTHPQSAAAHFEAIRIAVELARSSEDQLSLYEQLLLEHLNHWAASATADQARLWLGLLYRHSERWEEAIAVYSAVAPSSEHAVEALNGALIAWRGLLAANQHQPAQDEQLQRAIAYFESQTTARNESLMAMGAVAAARIRLEFSPASATQVLPLLEQAAQYAQTTEDKPLADEVESLIIACMAIDPALQNRAAQRLEKWQSEDVQLVLSLADRLDGISENLSPQQRQTIAKLQLQLVSRLRAASTDADTRMKLLRMEAFALAASGDRQRALNAFAQLVKLLPADGLVQIRYARLLEGGRDQKSWEAALTQWSNVVLHSPKRSDAWYEAKLGVARARLALGSAQQAVDLLQFTLEASPPPENSVWAKEIRELLAQAQQAQK